MDFLRRSPTSLVHPASEKQEPRSSRARYTASIANAVMGGDKELAAVGYVEQAADGLFTDVAGWRNAMGALDTGDANADDVSRARFHALMNRHAGVKSGAYEALVKSETSGFDRDELRARGQISQDQRAADLAQVNLTKNAYGGKITQIVDGTEDTVRDAFGETDTQRDRRRIRERASSTIAFSNLGGSEDAQLDALASLQNDTQRGLFELRMQQRVGKSSSDVVKEEMGVGIDGIALPGAKRRQAGLAYAKGDYEGATAMRMVSELDDFRLNDREDQASIAFERVRLSPEQQARIAALPEAERDEARKAETAIARERLLSQADDAAGGKGAYDKSPKQVRGIADEVRTATGKELPEYLAQRADSAGHQLHEDIEKATGTPHDVLTQESISRKVDGDFVTLPHERIGAAVNDGMTVSFGVDSHQRAIVGRQVLPDGSISYLVRDPLTQKVAPMPAADLDKYPEQLMTVALPAAGTSTKPR